jgi:predicted enzyme related to lactoylglutathione lyase
MADQSTRQPNFKPGDLCHFELPVRNQERAKAFYGKVFGWTFQQGPSSNYTIFKTPGSVVGGGLFTPDPNMPYRVTNYLCVDSIDEAAAKIKELGGKIVKDKEPVQGYGTMLHFEDPEGNLVALWKPEPRS